MILIKETKREHLKSYYIVKARKYNYILYNINIKLN